VPPEPRCTRRALLSGAAGAAALAVLGACGPGSDGADRPRGSIELVGGDGGRQLVAGFNFQGGYVVAGTPQRLTFLVVGPDGAPSTDVPDRLTFALAADGRPLGEPIVATRHAEGIPIPYFPLTAAFADAGPVTATVELDGAPSEQTFVVSDATEVGLVQPGAPLPAVETPTVSDARGVRPICTRQPACPLHDVTLADALGEARPLALLVGTPGFCRTGLCGPVLDLLVEQVATFPEVRFLHAEVYRDPEGSGDPAAGGLAPVVDALGLTFEPSLFVTDRDGTVRSRLDNVYDRGELVAALDAVRS
jgi:hypothetical protein